MTTTTVAKPMAGRDASNKNRSSKRRDGVLRQRTLRLMSTEIRFVSNHAFLFVDEDMEERILLDVERAGPKATLPTAVGSLPGRLAPLGNTEPLSAAAERELFFRMNYLKFRANALRARLDPDRPHVTSIRRMERLLRAARDVRDRIVGANTRLVMAAIKKLVTPQHSFDDLLSEGLWSLMSVVERFDYGRGFRFSTYAYRSITRHAVRTISDQRKKAARVMNACDQSVFELPAEGEYSEVTERASRQLYQQLHQLLNRLDRRDRFIVRCRYALGGHRKVKTCQYLADKLGVSKERVRQLEHRAVARLRAMMSELHLNDLADVVLG